MQEASLFGKGLHVVVTDETAATDAIRDFLRGTGCKLERLERITPSLEDVFVSLIEAEDRRGEPGAGRRAPETTPRPVRRLAKTQMSTGKSGNR